MAEDAPRILAADWTGAREPVRNLWLAEAESGALLSLEAFRLRDDLTDRLLRIARESRDVVVGLDFVFSLPEAFLRDQDLESAAALWSHMDRKADEWLSPRLPFWDRKKPAIEQEFRQTDLDVAKAAGKHPTSPFKLVGADQVGRGSLRGMEHLIRLGEEFAIWPFSVGRRLVVEIYPGVLVDKVVKSDSAALAARVRDDERVPVDWKAHAACSQDAFDAAMSALRMAEHAADFDALEPAPTGSSYALEGRIWTPHEGEEP